MKSAGGATSPLRIPARGWWDIAWRVKDEISNDRLGLVAAGIAFYSLLAIFPALTACMAIAGLVTEPSTIVNQLEAYGRLLPQEASAIIISQASEVAGSRGGGLGLAAALGLLIAIYSASKGVISLLQGLNVVYGEQESRGLISLYAMTFGLTLFLIVGLLLAIGVTVILPVIFSLLPFSSVTEGIVSIARWPLMALAGIFGLSVVYRYGPSRATPRWRWVTPGAVVACILWLAGSVMFAVYVGNFASYNETFGSLGGVVILLMWLWLSAFIVLLGAEIDSEMQREAALAPSRKPRVNGSAADQPEDAVAKAADALAAARKAVDDAENAVAREETPGVRRPA